MERNREQNISNDSSSNNVLEETFGIGKDIIKKTGQEFKDELRRELYNDQIG